MSKFDTHGGYFAPKDYLRVNEGGSHEENPNGGVQIGVDPEGNPNLLEEGEPVYKDYVYSDNIEAEEQFLVDNNLPKKYAGKLYSKIADDLFSEAEERPLDPISRNGLEALLGRLADAQEGQKQAKEQRDLEDELAQLSPEELDQLEAMLAEPQAMNGIHPGGDPVGPQGYMGAEDAAMTSSESIPVEGMPMMANGGFLRTFASGGPKKNMEDDVESILASLAESNAARAQYDAARQKLQRAQGDLWRRKAGDYLFRRNGRILNSAINAQEKNLLQQYQEFADNEGGIYSDPNSPYSKRMTTAIRQTAKGLRDLRKEKDKTDARIAVEERKVSDAEKSLGNAYLRYQGKTGGFPSLIDSPQAPTPSIIAEEVVTQPDSSQIVQPPIAPAAPISTTPKVQTEDFSVEEIDFGPFLKYGGEINRFDEGGFERLMNALRRYDRSTRQGGIAGTYAIDRRFPLGTEFKTIEDLENSEAYRKFTDYVVDHYQDPEVQAYLRLLDERTHAGVQKLFDGDTLRSDWERLYRRRRGDHLGGIYHFSTNVDELARPVAPAQAQQPVASFPRVTGPLFDFATGTAYSPEGASLGMPEFALRTPAARQSGSTLGYPHGALYDINTNTGYRPEDANLGMPDFKLHVPQSALEADMRFRLGRGDVRPFNEVYENTLVDFGENPTNINNEVAGDIVDERNVNLLPTWPRYAGAIGSGLLGLYNAFQQPDRYTAPHINPQLPEGRINLQNQVYNPIDQNMIANAQIAQGNATNRALRNSGLGPSTGAAILAADNNLTGNLGTGFIQAWDANNQRRNAVLAANNQAEAQRAQFDYTVDAARKEAINRFAPYNAQNDLMIQRLNNEAEADKYTAISNQISNGLQALSGIGQENFAMNQVNTNPAYLGYRVGPNGAMFYNPNTGKWEKVKS